jgi:hypothetical protein
MTTLPDQSFAVDDETVQVTLAPEDLLLLIVAAGILRTDETTSAERQPD